MRAGRRTIGVWRGCYAAAVRALPAVAGFDAAEVRRSMDERLADASRDRGWFGVARFVAGEIADVVLTGVRMRRRLRRRAMPERKAAVADPLWQDVRFTWRGWVRRPGFAVVAVLTLGLGIGANTAMFSVADAVLFRPLPHAEPERLAYVWSVIPGLDWRRAPAAYANYLDWRSRSGTFDDLAAMTGNTAVSVQTAAGPERVERALVSGNLFVLLGNGALLGRTLAEADDAAGADRVVVVSERFWRAHLGGTADAVGRAIGIQDGLYTVVGVMPASFSVPAVDLWMPLGPAAADTDRDLRFLTVLGRLAPGATLEGAERELNLIMGRLAAAYPAENEGIRLWVEPQRTFVVGDVRPVLLILLGAVGVVLVIACANLVNLLLARGVARDRELAVRAALGAGRRRLARQLLTESALLGVVGGAVGAALALAAGGALFRLAPVALPLGETAAIDGRALLFTAAVSLGAGVLVGIIPAFRVGRDGGAGPPGTAARGGMVGRGTHRLQHALVVAQIALALVLLVGAALLAGSLGRLLSVDPGFEPANVLAVHVPLPESRYPEREDVGRFFDDLIGRVQAIPGVERAGAVWALPFTNGWASGGAYPEGDAGAEPVAVGMLPVRGDAFEALGMRLVAGRSYTEADLAPDAGVVVINETMARRFWPGEDAVGKRFRRGSRDDAEERPWLTVIGVVADVKRTSLGAPSDAEAFFHHGHPDGGWASDMRLVVRTAADPLALALPIRAAVRALDPALALGEVVTMPQLIARSAAGPRIRTLLTTTFAALAALLAVIGIYGVMAFAVNERRREIGVRMALGARRGEVLAGVLRQGGALVATGLLLGLAGAAAATRLIGSLLFAVSPLDVRIYGATAALLACAALAACLIPAARAARVDPLVALRTD